MKRFYSVLALAVSSFFGAQAQNVDLEAFSTIAPNTGLCAGYHFSPTEAPTGDSVHGIYGIQFNGPEAVLEGDQVTFRSSFSNFLTEAEAAAEGVPFEDRYAWYSIVTLNATTVANGGFAYSYDAVDSIGMLLDWDRYELYGLDSITVYGPPHENFVNGQAYGFFVRTWGLGASADAIVNTDPDPDNNWSVVKIVWHECATSIKDLLAPVNRVDLKVYPNPAVTEVDFNYSFDKNTNAKAFVRDLTGRIVASKDLGHIIAGDRSFSMDVSKLSAGVYTLEMNFGTTSAVAKFTVKK